MEGAKVAGYATFFIGVALLIFTFYSGYLFLKEDLVIVASGDLEKLFGESMASLMKAGIDTIYLIIMGSIGYILLVKGMKLIIPYKPREKSE